jgi:nitroreductase
MLTKQKVLSFLEKALPRQLYNILLLKPRLKFVDEKNSRSLNRLKKQYANGIMHRGNYNSIYRKYAHILDKGLNREDRTIGHSRKIRDEIDLIKKNVKTNSTSDWGDEIVNFYDKFQAGYSISKDIDIEFQLSHAGPDEAFDLITKRRSIRYFKEKDIPEDIIGHVFESVNWAANSCNRQNTVLFVTKDKLKIEQCMRQNAGATCMNLPNVFVSVCSDTRSYILPTEREAAFIDASLGAQNVMLMCQAYKLGSCVLNWTHAKKHEEESLRRILGIPEHCEIVFNLLIGYPMKGANPPARKSLSDTVVWK